MGYYSYSTMGGFEAGRDSPVPEVKAKTSPSYSTMGGFERGRDSKGIMTPKKQDKRQDNEEEDNNSFISNVTNSAKALLTMLGRASTSASPLVSLATSVAGAISPGQATTQIETPVVTEKEVKPDQFKLGTGDFKFTTSPVAVASKDAGMMSKTYDPRRMMGVNEPQGAGTVADQLNAFRRIERTNSKSVWGPVHNQYYQQANEYMGTPTQLTSAGITSRNDTAKIMSGPNWLAREEINKARSIPITDRSGVFSNTKLKRAIFGSVTNPVKQSLLRGAIEVETDGAAPGMEDMGYRLGTKSPPTGAYKSYDDAVVDQALASLTPQQQARAITNVPMNALGQAIMDIRYDDGGTGRGGSFYRGGGLIQITGHNNYQEVQNILARKGINVDLIANPGLVNDTRYALPAALAFLEYAGMDNTVAEGMSAKRLNNMINRGAGREKAERRWGSVISSLRAAGETAKADELELRNEYAAQRKIGFTGATLQTRVDGSIGGTSRRVMTEYLTDKGVTIPANITDDALVILVNEN
jgi:hypothetical protein